MFKNYFKTAWRNLMRNKFYSAINITGLAIGLAVGIIILFWVQDEFSYDGFHHNASDIYKINSHLGTGPGAQIWDGAPGGLATFSKQVPGVKNAVRVSDVSEDLLFTYNGKKFKESKLAFVDSTFFSMFDFKLLQGKQENLFRDMHSLIITSSEAQKYFGNKNAIGQVIVTDFGNFTVSGVMEDFPANSSMKYSMLIPMSLYADMFEKSGGNGQWKTIDEDLGNYQYKIYLHLDKNISVQTISNKLTQLFREKKGDDAKTDFFTLHPLKTIHLIAADGNASALQAVRIFLVVAILILAIACINYVNLSTARSMLRSREVSVRKIIGAPRVQLFIQFIIESALLFGIASVLAFLLIYTLLPLYNEISGKHLFFSFTNGNVWIVVGCAVIGTLALASIYPALLLSSFKPIQALKGKLSFGIGNTSFRKVLVVTQFVFSLGLIIATIVISAQLKYIRDKNLGFDKDQVFAIKLPVGMHDHYDAVRNELLKRPGVLGITSSNKSVVGASSTTGDTYWDGKESDRVFIIHANSIDKDFIPVLKMQMAAGTNFTGSKADSAHFILNETAIRQAGIKDPIGKNFTLWQTKGTIIGVLKDFNYASLKQTIEPMIFQYSQNNWRMYVKTTGKDASKAIAAVQKIWRQYDADFPFKYSFLDDDFNNLYQSDQHAGLLFNVFAAVAIIISCLGLFGLTTYTAEVRIKEIGIRKVLGAGIAHITNLLVKDFIVLVIIAFVIAAPIAWFAMNKWLEDYAYRITLGWWMFLFTGLIAIAIAILTVSFQAIKAAIANPVKSLRTE